MYDSDLEELLKRTHEQEMSIFFPYELQTDSHLWGTTTAAISSLRLPTSVPSWDIWGILLFFETQLLLAL